MQSRQDDTEEQIQRFRVPGARGEPTLFAWCQRPAHQPAAQAPAVVYVCGATFASEQAVGFRFDGRSWADALAAAGYEVWAFDFAGYGRSERYLEMERSPERTAPLGRAPAAADQIERVVRFAVDRRGGGQVSLLAHSWGSMPACLFAQNHPRLVDRLVLFAPIVERPGTGALDLSGVGAWHSLSVEAQHQRFTADVPAAREPVLLQRHFEEWATAYLASDPDSKAMSPPGVRTPSGPAVDIATAWAGRLPYDPAQIRSPVCIVRGEWDSLCTDADAHWLWDALAAAPIKRDVKLSAGTHLLHLEQGRHALHRDTIAFLENAESSFEQHPGAQ
jgi:pimeloyl-ACP methyl ester carboxylesterase